MAYEWEIKILLCPRAPQIEYVYRQRGPNAALLLTHRKHEPVRGKQKVISAASQHICGANLDVAQRQLVGERSKILNLGPAEDELSPIPVPHTVGTSYFRFCCVMKNK